MRRVRLIVAPSEDGVSLHGLLTGRGDLSSKEFERALRAGGVTVNRRRASRSGHVLRHRDEVVAHLEEKGRGAAGPPPLDPSRLLLVDADVVVVDKPPGIPAQATAVDAFAGLDAAVSALLRSQGERNDFVGVVHRLDLETSGVTVFGRTTAAVRHLAGELREGRFAKRYLAIVTGHPDWETHVVDAPLGPSPTRAGSRAVRTGGDPSRTRFRCLERLGSTVSPFALLEAFPETGRTHQIRVHAAHDGFPLAGDRRYDGPAFLTTPQGERVTFPRVALHATSLRFPHPDGRERVVEAPLPADLSAVAARLRVL